VVLLGTNSKVDDTHYVEKADEHCYDLGLFDIHGFFGMGIHHKLFLTSLTFHIVISAV
jgi:hypothetical protein